MSNANEEYPRCTGSAFPPVLDACCGPRMMWFDRADIRAVFVDRREEEHTLSCGRHLEVKPDLRADFTDLPFPDNTFALVVLDPPHITGKEWWTGDINRKYGVLIPGWEDMLRQGFAECFRVLRPEGVLVFKWAESSVTVGDILKLTPQRPLFGHRSGKASKTHWIAFLKPNTRISGESK